MAVLLLLLANVWRSIQS